MIVYKVKYKYKQDNNKLYEQEDYFILHSIASSFKHSNSTGIAKQFKKNK